MSRLTTKLLLGVYGGRGGNPFAGFGSLIMDIDPDSAAYQTAGGALATAGDDPVALTSDGSGLGNTLAQSNNTLRPLLKLNAVNGHRALSFSGGQYLRRSGFDLSAFTLFVVLMNIGGAGTNRHIVGQWKTSTNNREWRTVMLTSNAYQANISSAGTSANVGINQTIEPGIGVFRYNLTTDAVKWTVEEQSPVTASSALFNGNADFTVGDMSDGVSQPGNFYLLRLLLYSNALADSEVTAVKAALDTLYAPFS